MRDTTWIDSFRFISQRRRFSTVCRGYVPSVWNWKSKGASMIPLRPNDACTHAQQEKLKRKFILAWQFMLKYWKSGPNGVVGIIIIVIMLCACVWNCGCVRAHLIVRFEWIWRDRYSRSSCRNNLKLLLSFLLPLQSLALTRAQCLYNWWIYVFMCVSVCVCARDIDFLLDAAATRNRQTWPPLPPPHRRHHWEEEEEEEEN